MPLNEKGKKPKVKVGHCGTLDPLAEGVLVVGIGSAVRLVPFVQQQPKHYFGRFRLGASSETGDLENGFTTHCDLPVPTMDQIHAACRKLTGEIEQVPPAYSAVWIEGERAYDRIRRGEEFEMPKRTVTIESITVTRYEPPDLELDIVCGSGTYIRTLGMDVAIECGTKAVMTFLQRTAIGSFRLGDAITPEQIRSGDLSAWLQPMTKAIEHLPKLAADDEQVARLRNGLCVDGQPTGEWSDASDIAALDSKGDLCAILRRKHGAWCPYRVFH